MNAFLKRLEGKAAIITGASRGIGAEIARRLAAEGASLILSAAPGEELLLHEIATETGSAACIGDLRDPSTAAALVDLCLGRFRRVDAIVNNAAIHAHGGVADIALDSWDSALRVNLSAAMLLAQAALPEMRKRQEGAIVNIGSQRAFASGHGEAAYESAKGGLMALTRSLAVDYGPENIRSNCISPGFILSQRAQDWMDASPRREMAMRAAIALRRPGLPQEIAGVAAFLLSDDAAYINGAVIPVDGGALAGLPENAALLLTERQ
jgi:NAD(P)-dependent dehydrogenase (short-subunit alcohol dehydrogenase family)